MENETGSLPRLKVRTVGIKASASRIGYEVDHFIYRKGVQIAKCDLDTAALKNKRFAMEQCSVFPARIADGADLKAFFTAVSQDYGGPDAIASNSRIKGTIGKLEQLSVIDWSRCFDICLTGQFLYIPQAVLLIKGKWWRLSLEYGIGCIKTRLCLSDPHTAAKFGVLGLKESLANELGPHNIRINAFLSRMVEGPRMNNVIRARASETSASFKDIADEYIKNVSLLHILSPDDVALSEGYLLSGSGKKSQVNRWPFMEMSNLFDALWN